jgi:biotin carboxyl carrier protein
MTRLEMEIDGRQAETALEINPGSPTPGATEVRISVEGQRLDAVVSQPEPGRYVVRIGTSIIRADRDDLADGTRSIIVNGRRITVAVRDRRRRRNQDSQASGAVQLVAPMPGKVVAVLVEEGAEVERGSGLIIIEAMKMQNEIQAPRAGRVVSLRATPGQTVNAGEILATLE